jgi:hypothetical protein
MLERDDILLSVILLLLILILLWICGAALLRRLGIGCLHAEHHKEDEIHKEIIKMDDEARIDYSFEIVQPEVKKQTNGNTLNDNKYTIFIIIKCLCFSHFYIPEIFIQLP